MPCRSLEKLPKGEESLVNCSLVCCLRHCLEPSEEWYVFRFVRSILLLVRASNFLDAPGFKVSHAPERVLVEDRPGFWFKAVQEEDVPDGTTRLPMV
jgi:hypothetical protein